MSERRDRIPPIVERRDGIDRAMPITLFDGNKTDAILKKEKGLIIPQGLKVIFEISKIATPLTVDSLGTITLGRDFEGAYAEKSNESYTAMPDTSTRIALIPDSDERRTLMTQYRQIEEQLKPLYRQQGKRGVARRLSIAKEKKETIYQMVTKIDRVLVQEFVNQRQEDLDFYNIDPKSVKRARIQIAVDSKITAVA